MSSKSQVDLGSLQVSELDAISEAIEKDSIAFIDEIKIGSRPLVLQYL